MMTLPIETQDDATKREPDVSVVIPVYNEAENLEELCREIHAVLDRAGLDFEVIFADDGSNDGTPRVLDQLVHQFPRVQVVTLRRNSGQTAALSAAIDRTRGRVLVPMDGDLQNDPADILRLMEKLRE